MHDSHTESPVRAQHVAPAHPASPPALLYLHGFRSGPQSIKARQLGARMHERGLGAQFWCEQLAWGPAAAMAQLEAVVAACVTPPVVVGSSLGGYYATWLAERHGLRAALINPSVVSYLSLAPYAGEQTQLYTGERFLVEPRHLDELHALEAPTIHPERYWLLLETGDEVLDWRQAATRYAGARMTVHEGGDHSFTHWPNYLDAVIDYALA